MKLQKYILTLIFIFLYSCADYSTTKISDKKKKIYYSSKGFALVYDENFYIEKIVNKKIPKKELSTMHAFLKSNTPIKIINPANSKFVETKVYKNANYPNIFNIVINKQIANTLELDLSNPYVEVVEIKKNRKFIAKESNTFDEEKHVAEKAPVEEIQMDDLSKEKIKKKKVFNNKRFTIFISDFYYKESAISLQKELVKKTNLEKIYVKKINNKKYRVLVGPFKNFSALKSSYISLNNLGFDELNVIRD